MNLRLHPEHGANPTMPICILCDEPTGEIALLGAGYKGEAPRHMVVGIEPCKKCRKKYLKTGTMLVECEREGNKEFITGTVNVVIDSAFKRIFNQEPPKGKIVKVEVGVLQKLRPQKQQDDTVQEEPAQS